MSVEAVTLQPFDPAAKCPKCDAGDAEAVWRPSTMKISRVIGLVQDRGNNPERGWMHRVCARCGYDWAEAPLDA